MLVCTRLLTGRNAGSIPVRPTQYTVSDEDYEAVFNLQRNEAGLRIQSLKNTEGWFADEVP